MKEQGDLPDLLNKLKKSEDRYRQLIEQASDVIYILTPDGYFTNVNESMCRLLGYARDELLTMNITDIVDPEQLKVDPLKYVGPAEPETAVVRERRFVHKDGKVIDVEINVKTFPQDRVMVIARDITVRKAMELELKTAELKFRTIADKSLVGIYIVQEQKFVYLNPRLAQVFGYTWQELHGKVPVDIIIHPEHRSHVRESIRARLTGETDGVHYETVGLCKDGTTNWVEFYGSRVVMNGIPSIIGTMLDITERKKAEQQIAKEKEALLISEANLQTILNNTDTAYLLLSPGLNVLECNNLAADYARREFNYTSACPTLIANVPAGHVSKFKGYVGKVLGGQQVSYEISYPEGEGHYSWYYVRMFPIASREGSILGIVLAATDITGRKRSEQHLQQAYKHIQRHVTSIKEMAWKQSHLIRSPLANLKALAGLLKADPSDAGVLNFIISELDRLDNVIIDMANEATDQTVYH